MISRRKQQQQQHTSSRQKKMELEFSYWFYLSNKHYPCLAMDGFWLRKRMLNKSRTTYELTMKWKKTEKKYLFLFEQKK